MKFIFVLFALICLTSAAVFQHNLQMTESIRKSLTKSGKWQEYMKYKNFLRHQAKAEVLTSTTQNVYHFDENIYYGNITIGTPEQHFSVALDTGGANFWIPDVTLGKGDPSDCPSYCSLPIICYTLCDSICCKIGKSDSSSYKRKNKFNSAKSKTYVKNGRKFTFLYSDNYVAGFLGQDTVSFVGTNGNLPVTNTLFGQAQQISPEYANRTVDGILGLAFTSLATEGTVPPLINANNQGLLDKPLFTVYLKHEGVKSGDVAGVVTYGGFDKINCEEIIGYQKLTTASYWQFHVDSISMATVIFTEGYETTSDTSAAAILVTKKFAEYFAQAAGALYNEDQEAYLLSCSSNVPDLNIGIRKNTFTVKGNTLVEDIGLGNGQCLFLIRSIDNGISFPIVLGHPFIKSYCNIYDFGNQRIGFALPKN